MNLQKQSIYHTSESLSHAKHTSSLFEIINSPPGLRKINRSAPKGAELVFSAYNENMLICISCLPPEDALGLAFARAKRGDVICLHRSVIGRLDMKKELDGEQKTVLSLMRLSAITRSAVFCAVRAVIDDDRYDSVIVFENGKLLGISDRISPRAGFCEGNNLRCYDSPCGRTGVLIGRDFEYPQLWQPLISSDCRRCIVFDERKLSPVDEKLLSSFSVCTGMTVFANFYDVSAAFTPDGAIRESAQGNFRLLCDDVETRKPRVLTSKPRLFRH